MKVKDVVAFIIASKLGVKLGFVIGFGFTHSIVAGYVAYEYSTSRNNPTIILSFKNLSSIWNIFFA